MVELSSGQMTEIRRFADTLGVDAIASADYSVSFIFERLGTLSIQPASGGRIVVSMARKIAYMTPLHLEKLLNCAGIDPVDGTVWHAGLTEDGEAVIALDLAGAGLSATDIDAALSRLAAKFEALA